MISVTFHIQIPVLHSFKRPDLVTNILCRTTALCRSTCIQATYWWWQPTHLTHPYSSQWCANYMHHTLVYSPTQPYCAHMHSSLCTAVGVEAASNKIVYVICMLVLCMPHHQRQHHQLHSIFQLPLPSSMSGQTTHSRQAHSKHALPT